MLCEVAEVRVGGRRPVGRPRKKWSKCMVEDMNLLGVEEYMAGSTNVESNSHPFNFIDGENTDVKQKL